MMNRRQLLATCAAPLKMRAQNDPWAGASLYRDLETYAAINEHRTATPGDRRTSEWLHKELAAAGFEATYQEFRTRQFFPGDSYLTISGEKIKGFPLWPARKGRAQGKLGEEIVIVRLRSTSALTPRASDLEAIQQAANGAKGVIAITDGPTGELIALNDESGVRDWPVPVLLMAGMHANRLDRLASVQPTAELIINGRLDPEARAENVRGLLKRGGKTVIVSTPKSGWFRCAGERGPGIALWLATARAVAARQSNFSYLFTANSGHELDGQGMREFLKTAPKPADVVCWLHYGAGLATYQWRNERKLSAPDPNRLLMCSKDVLDPVAAAFEPLHLKPQLKPLAGELELVAKLGYRCFGMAAAHRFHHTEADGPETTGPELLEPVARAFWQTLQAIEAQFAG
jgi:hypothetical protein